MKTTARILIVLICIALLYSTAMYGYVWMQMRPLAPQAPVSALQSAANRPQVHMIHAVNSVRRARAKDASFDGMEIDLHRKDSQLVAAHDPSDFQHAPQLGEIFAALAHPETKTFWLDIKTELTQADLDQLKETARQYHIHPRRMLFEAKAGPTADLVTANGFPLLLQIPGDFLEDEGNPQLRAQHNAGLEELLRRYQPFAIAASLGKYKTLQTYFPHYNKAIYSSTTKRPSLKKYFMTRLMQEDPSVRVWMQDEYTALPF